MGNSPTCPLCSAPGPSRHLTCTDNLVSGEKFDIYKCPGCGFVFTFNFPDEREIGRYYESGEYISHDDRAKGVLNTIYLQARNLMLKRKSLLVKKSTGIAKGSILDIGCGTGYFAGTMKKAGWEVKGIEPNLKAREFATTRFGIEILDPSEISVLADASFDCITMWHVMEHFHNLSDYAAQIRRLLKPGGICIAALPNCSSHDALHYGEEWAAWDVPRHLWHFTPHTFSIFAEKEGFTISNIKPLPLDVFYISVLSEKNRRSVIPFITGMIKGAVFAFMTFFGKNRSSSLIYFLKIK